MTTPSQPRPLPTVACVDHAQTTPSQPKITSVTEYLVKKNNAGYVNRVAVLRRDKTDIHVSRTQREVSDRGKKVVGRYLEK